MSLCLLQRPDELQRSQLTCSQSVPWKRARAAGRPQIVSPKHSVERCSSCSHL